MKDYRKAMIAKIHIAAKEARLCPECGTISFSSSCPKCSAPTVELPELQYRALLKKVTGKTSTRDMTQPELHRVLTAFYQLGFKPKKKRTIPSMISDSKQGMIAKIVDAAPDILGIKWHRRLTRFIEYKYQKSSLQFLTLQELRGVWAFLRAVEKDNGKRKRHRTR